MKQYKAYLVKLRNTNAFGTLFELNDEYCVCENNFIMVLTDDLCAVIRKLGQDNISEIKDYGVGYVIEKEEKEE